MVKKRLRKASNLIKKAHDSWGSVERKFRQRLLQRELERNIRKFDE